MAAIHGTAIAKATLSASLLRADPTPVVGDEIARLHSLLEKCITICTPENIKTCKHWLLTHLVHSNQRVTAFGKYLVALSASLKSQATEPLKPSSRRRRLYILYLLNDTIHHTTFYSSPPIPFGQQIEPFIKHLFGNAQDPTRKNQRARLENLLSIWSSKKYYAEALISSLRAEVADSFDQFTRDEDSKQEAGESQKAQQQILLPALHGDPNAPYHDLPATTMLPLMRPNSPTPISTRSIKPIVMKPGPPPRELSEAVDNFIKDVDKMWYGGDMRELPDVDELGVDIIKASNIQDDDEMLDDDNVKDREESYYGWSRGFAIRMTERRKGETNKESGEYDRDRGYSRSISRSRSRTRSRSSSNRSRSRDRYRNQSRDKGESRSRRRTYSESRSRSRSRSYSRSVSRSRSRSRSRRRSSRRRRRNYSRSYSRSRSRSRSHTRRRLNSSGSSQPYSPRLDNSGLGKDQSIPPPPPPPPPPSMPGNPPFPFNQQFPMPMPMPPEMAQFFQGGVPPPPPMGVAPQSWPMNMPFHAPPPTAVNAFDQWSVPGQQNMYHNQPSHAPGAGGNHGGYGNNQFNRGGYKGRGGWNNRGRGW